jgi:two-component system response regulator YesN
MFEQLIQKFMTCYVLSLDSACFAVIFHISADHSGDIAYIQNSIAQTTVLLHNYYNVTLYTCIGRFVASPLLISESYNDARQLSTYTSPERPMVYINEIGDAPCNIKNVFNLAIFKYDIVKTFENFDIQSLDNISSTIFNLFQSDTLHFTQAVDIVSSMLHFAITLLPNGTDVVDQIFTKDSENYLSLYNCKSVPQVLGYLNKLTAGLHGYFEQQQSSPKNQLMIQVKYYINEHIYEKLSLQGIADGFNISQNYLSQMFKQYYKIGFNEYITKEKVEHAKHLLSNGNMKIYEVADRLGFENAFYFSKVFKKVAGLSPKEYLAGSSNPTKTPETENDY